MAEATGFSADPGGTVSNDISGQISTAWDYITSILGSIWPFMVGLGVIIGLIALFRRISRMK